jgi:molecular chaperone GrpE
MLDEQDGLMGSGPDAGNPASDRARPRQGDARGSGSGPGPEMGAAATDADVETREARELREAADKYLRLAAEFENFRRRVARERSEDRSRAQADLAKQLLEPLDDLARFAHLDPYATDAATVVQGAELVERKLLKALGAAGLTVVNPVDQPFDPNFHEAVSTEPALAPEDDHMVARVYQPGYLFNGIPLRPARVVVKLWSE